MPNLQALLNYGNIKLNMQSFQAQDNYADANQSFIDEFIAKGYMHQCTNLDLLNELTSGDKKIVAYIGFDCTAKSLHIGNLMQIMVLRLLQKYGHKPIVLIGAGTTKIGDPTGKNQMRKILSEEEIEANIAGIKQSIAKFVRFESSGSSKEQGRFSDALLLNNDTWLSQIKYLDFLRVVGSKISINEMLTRDVIKNRLDAHQHLSLLEFNYMLCQGYDFYHLNNQYDCVMQIGGSDQWTNIISGVDIISKVSGKKAIGLTTKLLTTASGMKMGKTADGAVWLNEDMCPPYEYFQYWRNIEDQDILRFAHLYSDMSLQQLEELKNLVDTDVNQAKTLLASHLTSLCHGADAAAQAAKQALNLFGASINLDEIKAIKCDLRSEAKSLKDVLYEIGVCKSKGLAKDLIQSGAITVDREKITDIQYQFATDIPVGTKILLTAGKKNRLVLEVN